jgi:hypothetical protein
MSADSDLKALMAKLSPEQKAQFMNRLEGDIRKDKLRESIGILDAVSANMAQGVSASFADEIIGGIPGAPSTKELQERLEVTHEEYPLTSAVAEAVGTVFGLGKATAPAFAALAGKGAVTKIAGTAGLFAGEGMLTAAGKAKEGEDLFSETIIGGGMGFASGSTVNLVTQILKTFGGPKLLAAASGVLGVESAKRAMRWANDTLLQLFKGKKDPTELAEVIDLMKRIPVTKKATHPSGIPQTRLEENVRAIPVRGKPEMSVTPSLVTGVPGQPKVVFPGVMEGITTTKPGFQSMSRSSIVGKTGTATPEMQSDKMVKAVNRASDEAKIIKLRQAAESDLDSIISKDPSSAERIQSMVSSAVDAATGPVPRGFELISPTAAAVGGVRRTAKAAADLTGQVAAVGTSGVAQAGPVTRAGGALGEPLIRGFEGSRSLFSEDERGQ